MGQRWWERGRERVCCSASTSLEWRAGRRKCTQHVYQIKCIVILLTFFFFFFLVQHSQKAESGRLRIINFIFISIQSAPQELSGERGLINLIKITTSIIIIGKLLPLISARHRRQPLIITSCSKYLSSAKSPSGETHYVLL